MYYLLFWSSRLFRELVFRSSVYSFFVIRNSLIFFDFWNKHDIHHMVFFDNRTEVSMSLLFFLWFIDITLEELHYFNLIQYYYRRMFGIVLRVHRLFLRDIFSVVKSIAREWAWASDRERCPTNLYSTPKFLNIFATFRSSCAVWFIIEALVALTEADDFFSPQTATLLLIPLTRSSPPCSEKYSWYPIWIITPCARCWVPLWGVTIVLLMIFCRLPVPPSPKRVHVW